MPPPPPRYSVLAGITLLLLLGLALTYHLFLSPSHSPTTTQTPPAHPNETTLAPDPTPLLPKTNNSQPTTNNANSPLPTNLPLTAVQQFTTSPNRPHKDLLAEADANSRSGVYRFATPIPVSLSPETVGTWDRTPNGSLRWRLNLQSQGARSLNFGFTTYHMPHGGSLRISPPNQNSPYRDFTDADNEDHGQLWTPILDGDRALIEIEVPNETAREQLQIELTRVNHGLRSWAKPDGKIGGDTSGSCNVDVVCTAAEAGTIIIDSFRNQIRSVGAYTLNGLDTCSGAAINNTNQDGTPYFLTADHCGIDSTNDATMVVYWNFENSTCRPPGSAASGGVGDGNLSQFNSGAILRANNAASDFCLVELDDPIDPAHNIFRAGWNNASSEATSTVGIHHPAVAEKRISFDADPTTTTTYLGTAIPGDGSNLRVTDWDIGTTEGGSSGSPLFDQSGFIIGQLQGGTAACGNNDSDWYGRLSVSWTGGGSSATRLSDWLDPASSGVTTLAGVDFSTGISIDDVAINEGNGGTTVAQFTVTLNNGIADPVTVAYTTQSAAPGPTTATAGSDYVTTGGTLTFTPFDTSETISVTINGDTTPEENELFSVVLSNPTNAGLSKSVGQGTILNDDFITPVITSPLTANGNESAAFAYNITADNTPTSYGLSGSVPTGMTINTTTGLISWIPAAIGTFPVTISATNPAGSDSETLVITVAANNVLVGIDQDGTGRTLNESSPPWSLVATPNNDGTDAAASGNSTDSSTSWFELTVTGPDTLIFYWKVDSEPGFDFLELRLNGSLTDSISGNVDWTPKILAIPAGTNTIRWQYSKDGSISDGADKGYVDQVIVASDNPVPLIISPRDHTAVLGGLYLYRVLTSIPADTITVTGLPAGLTALPDGTIVGTTAPGTYPLNVTATNTAGSDVATLNLTLISALSIAAALDIDTLDLAPGATPDSDADWFAQSTTTHDTVDAAQAGDINDNEISEFKIDTVGPGNVSFWWQVNSEDGFDFLDFLVDGQIIDAISGNVTWEQVTHLLPPGEHELRWRYIKDGSLTTEPDTGWVDELSFNGYAAWIVTQSVNGRAALLSNADGDPFYNIADYYHGFSATQTNAGPVPQITVVGGNHRVTIPKRAGVTDVTGVVKVSTDLANWTTLNTNIVSNTPTELIVEETFPTPKPRTIFFQLTLSSP